MAALDQTLYLSLNLGTNAPRWLVDLAYASSNWILPVVLTATVAMALFGRAPWRGAAWRVVLTVIVASILAGFFKHALALPRPGAFHLGVQWMQRHVTEGFPSSHATVSMAWALAAALAPVRNGVRVAFFVAAALVSWSRVALGLHFPSQIVAGWALALACTLAVQPVMAWAGRTLAPPLQRLIRRARHRNRS